MRKLVAFITLTLVTLGSVLVATAHGDKSGDHHSDSAHKEDGKKHKDDKTDSEAQPTAEVGEKAPEFELTDAQGNKHSLNDYEGKLVVLEWTSPECPFVKRHYKSKRMPETYQKIASETSEVVWLAIDSSHFNKPQDSKKWKQKHSIPYPILQDSEGTVGRKYGAKTTPHMYVIDKEGTLRYKGAIDNDEWGKKDSPTNYVVETVKALKKGESPEKTSVKPYGCSVKYD